MNGAIWGRVGVALVVVLGLVTGGCTVGLATVGGGVGALAADDDRTAEVVTGALIGAVIGAIVDVTLLSRVVDNATKP